MFLYGRGMGTLHQLTVPHRIDVRKALRAFDEDVLRRAFDDPSLDAEVEGLGGRDAIERLLTMGSDKAQKNRRRIWPKLTALLDRRATEDDFVRAAIADSALPPMLEEAICGRAFRETVPYPLTEEEREALAAIAPGLASKARAWVRVRDDAKAAERRLQNEENRRRNAERNAERRRLEAEARTQAEARRLADDERRDKGYAEAVAAALAMSPAARNKALLVLTRKPWFKLTLIPEKTLKEAVEWGRRRDERERVNKVAREARKAAEAEARGAKARPPRTRHLTVAKDPEGFSVRYAVTPALALGSDIRSESAERRVRSALGAKHCVQDAGMQAFYPNAAYETMVAKVEETERLIDALLAEPLTPQMLEQALGITSAERLKWQKGKRLPPCGSATFKKGYRVLTYYLHDPKLVFDVASRDLVPGWRADDAAAKVANRKRGAQKAARTRVENEESRKEERSRVDALVREAAREAGSLVAVPVIKLGIMASLCSRWAKHHQERNDREGRAEFYALKDEALRIIAASEWASLSYRPAHEPKVTVDLCEDHRDDFRDCRRMHGGYLDFWDWVDHNRKSIRQCNDCSYDVDPDRYALYEIKLEVGPARFSWHVPYGLGRSWLPERSSLPSLPSSGFDDETGYMFGRPIHDDEAVLWPAPRLKKEMRALLDLFATDHSATAGAERITVEA